MQLLYEAISIGILVIIMGYLIIYLMKEMKLNMSRDNQMTLGFFILGVSIHLFCEFTGINKWYCKNGNACLKR
jgi:hypothetical protein